MPESAGTFQVVRCPDCLGTFLPRKGPCPRCGAIRLRPDTLPAVGVVLAATELWAPPKGWTAPHQLVLLECAELVRVLAWTSGPLPSPGSDVRFEEVAGGGYRLRTEPGSEGSRRSASGDAGRGNLRRQDDPTSL